MIYQIPLDNFNLGLILDALREQIHKEGINEKAKDNYLQLYWDIKEVVVNK